jgi:hypothetical protein
VNVEKRRKVMDAREETGAVLETAQFGYFFLHFYLFLLVGTS